ncbi:PD-(D/E)XK nuclease-like domain-containing protein [Limosilactobacillus vaginalis]|uniref:PD-(D/E)XK nuclease-like domain-containing protein n=1 Tax=Limosilactobacillus vaginalis TaxID=1633 RepID=UPI003AB5D09D
MKLTADNYYSHDTDWQYMSFSLFKDFEQCEARALAKLKEDWQPTSSPVPLLVGNYVHSYFESAESHQSFVNENHKELMTRPTKKNPEGHLRAEFKVADGMIKTLSDDNMFNYFYKPGKKEVIVTGKIDGYLWKGKIDSLILDKNYFCDLKTVDDIHKFHYNRDVAAPNFIYDREYDLQMAIYRELIKQTFGVECNPYIFAVSKQTPPDHDAFKFEGMTDKYAMDDDIRKVKEMQPHFWKVMTGEERPIACGKCDYCREAKQLTGFTNASEIEV